MRYELLGVHPESGQWRWEKSRSLEAVDNYKKYLAQAESGLSLDDYFLDHLTSTNVKLNFVRKSEEGTIQYYVPPSEGKLLSDNWMDITLSGNETQEFDTEKSVHLLQRIVEWACDKNGIVLDFFSGSGTTAHATMAINGKDGGERKFILVQLPEPCSENSAASKAGYKNIADITKDRIRRAGESFVSEKTPDVGFRVLKIDTSNMSDICYIPDALTQGELFEQVENVKSDRNEEDLLFQVMLDWGVELTLPIRREIIGSKTVFFVDAQSDNTQGALVACFDKTGGINEVFIKQLATFNPLRLVFRDAGFSSDATKINVEQLLKQLSPATDVKTI